MDYWWRINRWLDELLKSAINMVDELYENTNYEVLPVNERVILKKENAE